MNIALITPSSQNISAFGGRTLSALLKQHGHTVTTVTLPIIPDLYRNRNGFLYANAVRYSARIIQQLLEVVKDCDLVGVSFMTFHHSCAVQITRAVRDTLSIPVIWGGVHPTVRPEESLRFADIVCVGEGEGPLVELADHMSRGTAWKEVANLCFNDGARVVKNPVRPLIQDLDSLPFLDYGPDGHWVRDEKRDELVPFDEEQFERSLAVVPYYKRKPLRSFMFFTTRGCPYSCAYCVNDFYRTLYGSGGFVRRMSVERVVTELAAVIRKHPCIEEIEFCDDNFALRPTSEIQRFCSLYKKEIGLPFQLLISPQNIIEEKVTPLVDAGLVFVETGIQSAAEVSEDMYQRKADEDRLLKAAAILNGHMDRMAPPCYHLILDNPFESVNDTLKTFELTLKLPRPFWFKRSSLVAFPGTSINTRFAEAGLITNEEEEVFRKILEMPSTSYINFLFLLGNQNYPRGLLRWLSRPVFVGWFNRPAWIPVFGFLENMIRAASKLSKALKMVLRGEWGALGKRIAMISKSPGGMISSRPPSY